MPPDAPDPTRVGPPDLAAAVDALSDLAVNYDDRHAPPRTTTGWHRDRRTVPVGRERPGEPEPGGVAETAYALVDGYGFTDARQLRATWRPGADVVGRDMLLEGRFLRLRFLMGVRVTESHDEHRSGPHGPERAVGWSYRTLDGHLEQGRLTYEVVKEIETGRVTFSIDAYSRRAPIANPLLRLGFVVFGRANQRRFYRFVTRRVALLADRPLPPAAVVDDGLVHAPAGARPDRFPRLTLTFRHPGR